MKSTWIKKEQLEKMKMFIKKDGQSTIMETINKIQNDMYRECLKQMFGIAVHELEGVPN